MLPLEHLLSPLLAELEQHRSRQQEILRLVRVPHPELREILLELLQGQQPDPEQEIARMLGQSTPPPSPPSSES